jgi:hypothetical protein
MNGKLWTAEEDAIMRREFPHKSSKIVAGMLHRSLSSVQGRATTLGLHKTTEYLQQCSAECGRQVSSHPRSIATRIPKGTVPPNKGLRRPGWHTGRMQEGWFRKGHKNENNPHFERSIGALRVNADGYLERKVRNDLRGSQRWKAEHVLVWQAEHGPVPRGHIVVFKDRDKTRITPENLECITLAENMRRNTIHVRRSPEIKEAIYGLIAVKRLITMREKKNAKKQAERFAGSSLRDARDAQG